jgi:hypothetical protein
VCALTTVGTNTHSLYLSQIHTSTSNSTAASSQTNLSSMKMLQLPATQKTTSLTLMNIQNWNSFVRTPKTTS